MERSACVRSWSRGAAQVISGAPAPEEGARSDDEEEAVEAAERRAWTRSRRGVRISIFDCGLPRRSGDA